MLIARACLSSILSSSDPSQSPQSESDWSVSEGLGVSLVDNYQGRGINVGFGRGSDISDDHLPALIPLGLNELYLSRTEISDESLAQFEAMVQLRVLDLSHTNLSRDGIKQLKESLPHAKIIG